MKGTIKTLKSTFGFITVEGQNKDLFFHSSETSQFENLQEGDNVEFDEGEGRKGDTVAITVEKIE